MPSLISKKHNVRSLVTVFVFVCGLLAVPLTASCSGFGPEMSESDALKVLRDMTRDNKLPPEGLVLDIENRFSRVRAGVLAKLLRARIKFENKDYEGAQALLNSDIFKQKTKLADYALWLRGRALQGAGRHTDAMSVFSSLIRDYPTSLRVRESKVLWANSAISAGQAAQVPAFLAELNDKNLAAALLATARSYDAAGNQAEAIRFFRRVYFFGAGSPEAKEAEMKLTLLGQSLSPLTADEAATRADKLFAANNFADADKAYAELMLSFPSSLSAGAQLKRLTTLANVKKMPDAALAFASIPANAVEKESAYYELALGYARNKLWANAKTTAEEMRARYPNGKLTPKTFFDLGMAARDARNKLDESYFLRTAVAAYPNSVDIAKAQFELAWLQHEAKNYQMSSEMFTEHLARYVDKDSTNRGKAGYWAARDSQLAGKIDAACALYDAVIYRYGANWYGHLSIQRISALRSQGKCQGTPNFPAGSLIPKAAANLKIVTVAAETAGERELERAEKSDDLSVVGLFEWAIDELKEARRTTPTSPKINLALARHHRLKGEQAPALLALAKSYPDYAQMFPEEMGREEWDIFYPLTNWNDIKYWAAQRRLDPYQVAGFIRQETIFDPRAKSSANAYGMMQLLLPTARAVAKKYNPEVGTVTVDMLYQPTLNIELGTAYIRDQYDKFGRVEFVAVAYNAGPGRVPQWTATLPAEIDEFVELIPFKETKGYVQGIIRNTAQYRRLYDENGNFKPNVGTRVLRGEIDSKPRDQFTAENPDVVLDDNRNGE
ncbi:MAG: transglycosylase SLT domain-containing protein [Acidobacteria bacterium]|nr:transglycosylase SLT domain-containing protein [Acidobacteriota bacterium]